MGLLNWNVGSSFLFSLWFTYGNLVNGYCAICDIKYLPLKMTKIGVAMYKMKMKEKKNRGVRFVYLS